MEKLSVTQLIYVKFGKGECGTDHVCKFWRSGTAHFCENMAQLIYVKFAEGKCDPAHLYKGGKEAYYSITCFSENEERGVEPRHLSVCLCVYLTLVSMK